MTARRLTLLNSLALLASAALFGLGVLLARTQVRQLDVDAGLRTTADTVARATLAGGVGPQAAETGVDPFAARPVFAEAVAPDGRVLFRSANLAADLPVTDPQLRRALSGDAFFQTVTLDGHRLRSYTLALRGGPLARDAVVGVLEVASPMDEPPPSRPILASLALGVLAGVVGAFLVGWLLARLALAPVERLAATVASIQSTADLGRRVPLASVSGLQRDPVGRLAAAMNQMLARLEAATRRAETVLEAQRQFVADASHELRTPLTSLRGNVQFLSRLCAEDCPAERLPRHQEVLVDLDGESERMSRLVAGLLVLARADAQQHLHLEPSALEPLLHQAYRAARPMADDVLLEIGDLAPGVHVLADPDRLLQLVMILLDNALRYTPPGGRVRLSAAPTDHANRAGVVIDVADTGPGVPADERSRIFERFYRSSVTPAADGGAGLGLAVARWIAQEHHAEISVHDAPGGGSVFRVWLPRLREPNASPQFTSISP